MPQYQPRNESMTQQDLQAIFLRPPKPEDFKLTAQEKQALVDLLAWENLIDFNVNGARRYIPTCFRIHFSPFQFAQ